MTMLRNILFLLVVSVAAVSQGYRYDNFVVNSTGVPVANPTIRVCTEPATGSTCTPIANVYSDQALTVPLANPFTGDANGNFGFYWSGQAVHVQVSGTGITTKDLPYILGGFGNQVEINCGNYSGTDPGARINACIGSLPTTGGIIDACGISGASIGTTIANGTKTVLLKVCSAFTASVTPVFNITKDLLVYGSGLNSGFTAASGGVVFQGSSASGSIVRQFTLKDLMLHGNGASSQIVKVPSFVSGGPDWAQAMVNFNTVVFRDSGSYGVELGQSVYPVTIKDVLFINNNGSFKDGWASDFVVENVNFWSPPTTGTNPQLYTKGGARCLIKDSDFERDDQVSAGDYQQPDIFFDADGNGSGSTGSACKVVHTKFGPEGESPTRNRIEIGSGTSTATNTFFDLTIEDNFFGGVNSGNPSGVPVKLTNPVTRFRFVNNFGNGYTTIINDAFTTSQSDTGHNVFDCDNSFYNVGANSPTQGLALFSNGGLGFSRICNVGQTADPTLRGAGVTESVKPTETPKVNNRVPQSEDFTSGTWSKSAAANSTPPSCGVSDPLGGTRACTITADGTGLAQLSITLSGTSLRSSGLMLSIWAQQGTLTMMQAQLLDNTTGKYAPGAPPFTLGSDWVQYGYWWRSINTGHTFTLVLTLGNLAATFSTGTVKLFGVQVSDFNSDYCITSGASCSDTTVGTIFNRNITFGTGAISGGAGIGAIAGIKGGLGVSGNLAVQSGSTLPASGAVQMPNNTFVKSIKTDAATTVSVVGLNSSDQVAISQSGIATTFGAQVNIPTFLFMGSNAASCTTGGCIDLPNNVNILGRNQANAADVAMIKVNTSDQVELGNGSATIKANGPVSAASSVTATTFVSGATYQTATNCAAVGSAANPSVAACGSAASGSFSCATAASTGTCTINTTAVTANSVIWVIEDDGLGAKLGVTCNTGTTVLPTHMIASRSAGVSFTINLGTVTTNPACFSYGIMN